MITLNKYIKKLQEIVKEYPELSDKEVIYSHDDEGNEYQKVNNLPSPMTISNIEDNRFLEISYIENEGEIDKNYNCTIVN